MHDRGPETAVCDDVVFLVRSVAVALDPMSQIDRTRGIGRIRKRPHEWAALPHVLIDVLRQFLPAWASTGPVLLGDVGPTEWASWHFHLLFP